MLRKPLHQFLLPFSFFSKFHKEPLRRFHTDIYVKERKWQVPLGAITPLSNTLFNFFQSPTGSHYAVLIQVYSPLYKRDKSDLSLCKPLCHFLLAFSLAPPPIQYPISNELYCSLNIQWISNIQWTLLFVEYSTNIQYPMNFTVRWIFNEYPISNELYCLFKIQWISNIQWTLLFIEYSTNI